MDYRENKIQKIFNWVYLIICIHGLWGAGLLLGVGVFGLIPSTVTSFEIMREAADEYTGSRLKMFSFWWKQYKKNFVKYRIFSFAYHLLLVMLTINYVFLSNQTSFITLILFYLTLFLFLFSSLVYLWFSFIAAEYPHLELKEIIQNAIAFPISRLVEMIIYAILLISGLLIILNISPGLIVFTGMGLIVLATRWVFLKIHDGAGVHVLFGSLKRNRKTI